MLFVEGLGRKQRVFVLHGRQAVPGEQAQAPVSVLSGMQDPEKSQPLNTQKYKVERTDGSTRPDGKHSACPYFVLDLVHDRFAVPALRAYADACEAEFPPLAKDVRAMVADLEKRLVGDLVEPLTDPR